MMDILMIGILAISFGLVTLFAHWCDTLVRPKKRANRTEVL